MWFGATLGTKLALPNIS